MATIITLTFTAAPWLCLSFVLYMLGVVIYNVYFHPLARFPGPFLAKISNFYTYQSIVKQDRMLMQTRMLEKYGSPVRVAPNELAFSDLKSYKEIHGQSSQPCLKDPAMYSLLTATGAVSLISATDRREHARLRRILTPGFGLQEMLRSEHLIAEKVETFMKLVFSKYADTGSVDIYDKIQEHHLDMVSQLSFGKSFNTLSGEKNASHRDVDLFLDVVPAIAFFPAIKYLPLQSIKDGMEGLARLQKFSRDAIVECIDSIEKGDDGNAQRSFLKGLITAVDPETGSKLSIEELVENTIIFLVAGTDTTAVTTTYTIWETARKPDVRKKLVEEIRTAFPDSNIIPTYREASKLPYLSAVLEECLRLYGPSNIGVPRLSPGRILGTHYIPKNTVVSTIPYAIVRDPTVFPDPLAFNPERWLQENNPTPAMRDSSRPFGYGPRGCVARHFAEVSFTLTLVRLFQLFDVVVDEGVMNEEMMRQKDRGVLHPWDTTLVVKVRHAGSRDEEVVGEKEKEEEVEEVEVCREESPARTVEIFTYVKDDEVESVPLIMSNGVAEVVLTQ